MHRSVPVSCVLHFARETLRQTIDACSRLNENRKISRCAWAISGKHNVFEGSPLLVQCAIVSHSDPLGKILHAKISVSDVMPLALRVSIN
jgi:hypothetical protein